MRTIRAAGTRRTPATTEREGALGQLVTPLVQWGYRISLVNSDETESLSDTVGSKWYVKTPDTEY
jgi:hypothetical protein